MPAITLSTASLPERDQFPFWAGFIDSSVVPVGLDRVPGSGPGFRGEAEIREFAGATLVVSRSDNYRARRGREHVARMGGGLYSFFIDRSQPSFIRTDRHELLGGIDTGLMLAPEALVDVQAVHRFDHFIYFIPAHRLDRHLPSERRAAAWQIRPEQGVGGLALAHGKTLMETADRIAPDVADVVLDNFCRLLAIAAGAAVDATEGGRGAVRAARLERAKWYVERHLADTALSPASAARALGISVRQLHSLFERTGTSFSRYVMMRRLEETRGALEGPAGVGRSVTEIAFAWGFESLPGFYRAFRRAYGVAPGELRAMSNRRRER